MKNVFYLIAVISLFLAIGTVGAVETNGLTISNAVGRLAVFCGISIITILLARRTENV